MKCWIGLGSNLGDRLSNLEQAARKLRAVSSNGIRVSGIDVNPAMVPAGAPDSWRIPFFNAVAEIEWTGSAGDLLKFLKKTEQELGRTPAERWAPRILDLDLLMLGGQVLSEPGLQVPHPGLRDRSFVLGPLSQLQASLKIPETCESVLSRLRQTTGRSPQWMGILNLTPDSFSDGGKLSDISVLQQKVDEFEKASVGYLDLGAESTRPGAAVVDIETEWQRFRPALEILCERNMGKIFRSKVSVDTRHIKVAERALEWGADMINDVSGLQDPGMIDLLKSSRCDYVLMHSLTVPADPKRTLSTDADPITELRQWAEAKLEELDRRGISMNRVIFDPGVGFGKTALQSYTLLRRFTEFQSLSVRLLIGHSRKSFLSELSQRPAAERDPESIGTSLQMISKGADILRVHEAPIHIRAYRAFQEAM